MTTTLDELTGRGAVSFLDRSFARSLARLAGEDRDDVLVAVALACRQVQQGDVCLDLQALVGGEIDDASETESPASWPSLEAWVAALESSPLVSRPGRGATPLVLDERGRLYLRRLFVHEERVADALASLSGGRVPDPLTAASLRRSLDRLLPSSAPDGETDWPRVAAAVAAVKRLCVISGGPGTGKTTTAARLLAVLIECALDEGAAPPRIALAAPTGKAAARLCEAISRERARLDCTDEVRAAIPEEAATLHHLLGLGFRRRPESRRLRADVVLVDEASMVDLSLMARLVEALPTDGRLILLGDADQLASVEAGSVFADLRGPEREPGVSAEFASWLAQSTGRPVAAAPETGPVQDCVVTLTKSHRYAPKSGIAALATAIRAGDAGAALDVLSAGRFPDVELVPPSAARPLAHRLASSVLSGYRPFAHANTAARQLACLDRFRVLCAVRAGPFGVAEMNRAIDALLVDSGLLAAPARGGVGPALGRPLLVTRNAPHVGLFNGDVGVVVQSRDGGRRRAEVEILFKGPGGSERRLALSRLPRHEPVFAMSVHKSQGSEFDEVALVLPDTLAPVLSRELVYTAVTRARLRVVVHASEAVLAAAIERRVTRASGLRDALWPRAALRGTV